MNETKYIPKKYVNAWRILSAAMVIMTLTVAWWTPAPDWLMGLWVCAIVAVVVTRFVWFRCPHCGRVMNLFPKKEVREGVAVMYCTECGGAIGCK